ncbi:MAG TPA: XTP/dITP diphosphatase [Nitrospirota bacterium]
MQPDFISLKMAAFYDSVALLMEIVLATRNKKKIEEIKRITAGLPVTVLSLGDFPNCPEVVEDRETFEGNAVKKAVEVCRCAGKPALADDSGLEVEALGGAPGVYSARYAGGAGGGNDVRNYEKLLSELQNVPDEKRGARFVCCMALAYPDGSVKTFFGYAEGCISREPKGTTGFGYDPVFIPRGYKRTFAEMPGEEKDCLSHRGKALEKIIEFIRSYLHL